MSRGAHCAAFGFLLSTIEGRGAEVWSGECRGMRRGRCGMLGSVRAELADLESKIYVNWRKAWRIGLG